MDVVVALDFRFDATPDGAVWTSTAYPHSFWTRYLDVFDGVRIFARAASVRRPADGARRVDGGPVSFHAAPFYLGPAQYLWKASSVRRAAGNAVGRHHAVILRVGSQLASCIASAMARAGRPYGLEVVGDPYDAFAPGAIRHPLRAFFRWRNTAVLRRMCAGACGAAYVTESALQRRYPCPAHMAAVSDVELSDEFWGNPTAPAKTFKERRLIFVGSLEQMYKGPDVLIDALAVCLRSDPSFSLSMAGEGRHLPELRRRAAALGIQDRVRFLGALHGAAAVREELDRSSIFVLPSRSEGLPRAMLEAMARGLPCLGSNAGGIPELLAPEDLVPVGDAPALALRILEVARDPRRLACMSERNRRKAAGYRDSQLRPRRLEFYRRIAAETSRWIDAARCPEYAGAPETVCPARSEGAR